MSDPVTQACSPGLNSARFALPLLPLRNLVTEKYDRRDVVSVYPSADFSLQIGDSGLVRNKLFLRDLLVVQQLH